MINSDGNIMFILFNSTFSIVFCSNSSISSIKIVKGISLQTNSVKTSEPKIYWNSWVCLLWWCISELPNQVQCSITNVHCRQPPHSLPLMMVDWNDVHVTRGPMRSTYFILKLPYPRLEFLSGLEAFHTAHANTVIRLSFDGWCDTLKCIWI